MTTSSRFDYDQHDIHLRYDVARQVPAEAMSEWLDQLAAHLPDRQLAGIVDLGCGTGRFSAALASRFNVRVFAVDPSENMLNVARQQMHDPRVEFVRGQAEDLPLDDDSSDVIFMSMVYHHLQDVGVALAECRRVLVGDGRLAIRLFTRERLDEQLWPRYFPEAWKRAGRRPIETSELLDTLAAHRFSVVGHETLTHPVAENLHAYADRIALRGYSSLQEISDAAFARGLAEFRAYCAAHDTGAPAFEDTDLYVFSPGTQTEIAPKHT